MKRGINGLVKRARGGKAMREARVEIAQVLGESVRLARLVEWEDGRRLMEHAVASMVRLTEAENEHVALGASEWLAGYAGKLLADEGKVEATIDVVNELRELYRKALPEGDGGSGGLVEAELEAEIASPGKKPS